MASLTLRGLNDRWPEGTSLTIRPESNFGSSTPPVPGQAPLGSATDTQTVSGDAATFVNLADDTAYVVTDSGGTKYVRTGTKVSHGAERPESTITNLTTDLTARGKVEVSSPPFIVYMDKNNGSDSNNGDSPGRAFATLEKAINTLQIAGKGGEVRILGVAPGFLDVAAPICLVQSISIVAHGPQDVSIRRNFTVPNGRSVWDAITTASGTSVQSATAAFDANDVNRIACIYGAGTGGGTYYGFITAVPDATHATIPATVIARNSTTDPKGVKLSVVGDWNRVVTDAAMTSGGSVVTSATAAWTNADIGTAIVVAGAGQGGQALRGAIVSISGNTATISAVAAATVSGKRCAIGVNFGDLICYHAGGGGIRNATLTDTSATAKIGAAVKVICDDLGAGSQNATGELAFEHVTLTSTDAVGAWEHMIDCDGSWNQKSSGPGSRRVNWVGAKVFGSRRPTETIRLNGAVHWAFIGGGIVGAAPTSVAQGCMVLDPQKTAGIQFSNSDVNFTGFEGVSSYLYMEGQLCSYVGGRLNADIAVSGRNAVELGSASDGCFVNTVNKVGVVANSREYDAGTNNRIETTQLPRLSAKADEGMIPNILSAETFTRRGAPNASQAVGSSGVMVCAGIWLPGGFPVAKVVLLGGGTALAWGSGWTGPHFIYGLYDPDGNLIGQSADTGGTAAFDSSFSSRLVSLTATARAARSGVHYIGLLINSGTGGSGFTYPTFGGQASAISALAPALCGTNGSALTALPAGPITVTGANFQIYGGVASS